ncbi:DNA-directed RNA polymerase [Dichotomocladium elegans]|nr:DNA-directed RNA polymerase [Dichotomocladium elegans]
MDEDKRQEEDVVMEDVQSDDEHSDAQSSSDGEVLVSADTLEIIAGASGDYTAMTFCFKLEDHTLGNSLRHMINKNPEVDFCGYSIPHPSEAKMHMRIQTTKNTNAVEALRKGMNDLNDLCEVVRDTYMTELARKDYIIEDQ